MPLGSLCTKASRRILVNSTPIFHHNHVPDYSHVGGEHLYGQNLTILRTIKWRDVYHPSLFSHSHSFYLSLFSFCAANHFLRQEENLLPSDVHSITFSPISQPHCAHLKNEMLLLLYRQLEILGLQNVKCHDVMTSRVLCFC